MSEHAPPDTPPGQAGKLQYEYRVFYTGTQSHHDPEFVAKMNELGLESWYLTAVATGYMYFVREIK